MVNNSIYYLKSALVIRQFETNAAGLKSESSEQHDRSFCVTEGTVFGTRLCSFYNREPNFFSKFLLISDTETALV